jgi:phage tail sheath protein FI
MPSYLAPGVYVEEIETGPTPIEGVSTSTAGLVGMTERGPVNAPILVTSSGDFSRWFGGLLDIGDFGSHCSLPHAVNGFFTNGGQLAYIVRVLPPEAASAARVMYDRGTATGLTTVLLQKASQSTGTAATEPLYLLGTQSTPALAAGQTLRIGNGSRAEYLAIDTVTADAQLHVPLDRPLVRAHAAGAAINETAFTAPAATGQTLAQPAAAGATVIIVHSASDLTPAGLPLPWLVYMTANGITDIAPVSAVTVADATAQTYRVVLNQPLAQGYPTGAAVTHIASHATASRHLRTDAASGDLVLLADAAAAAAVNIVEIDPGDPALHEVHLSGTMGYLPLAQQVTDATAARSTVAQVALQDDGAATTLNKPADAGTRLLSLASRIGLAVGDVLRIGAAPSEEFVTIVAIPGGGGPAPDAGTVTVTPSLVLPHANGVAVARQHSPPGPPTSPHRTTQTILAAAAGDNQLLVALSDDWAVGDFARVTHPSGDASYHRISATPVRNLQPALVAMTGQLARTHQVGEPVVLRTALFDVAAIDDGAWGNRLLIAVADEASGLAARAQTTAITPPLQLTVNTLTGIEPGTVLEVTNPNTGNVVLLKVRGIDRSNRTVALDPPGLDAATLAQLGTIAGPLQLRSREFQLTALLLQQPNPAIPSRSDEVLNSEVFDNLSMDHRHSRYFQTVIGDIHGPHRLEDRRPEGESNYIRVSDRATPTESEAIRLGPEALIDWLPGGVVRPARLPLSGGDDSVATVTDATYLGQDDAEPLNRTGLASLRNIPQVSLVAIPGQGSGTLQGGVIAHCELMRYRFAVLDPAGFDFMLADIQNQRQMFDTKYAALYYPWLTIDDPMPANLAAIGDFPLPPSGHVLGVFARTDLDRGVHKAPANEVVQGITGLTRRLTKGEQEILNPSPVNINVIRDFRPDGRAIRIWGARCITSDAEFKYVPVRRLLIFIEQSIDLGLQWVVFEPNAEPLWARVRQSISNFLTDVWRSGALEGTKPEEAYFVKCDRTTMTQSDIDNGRLICIIGVAPVKPAEFVIIRIGLFTANAQQ